MIHTPVYIYLLGGQGREIGTSMGLDYLAGRLREIYAPRCKFLQVLSLDWKDYKLIIDSLDLHHALPPSVPGMSTSVNIVGAYSLGGNWADVAINSPKVSDVPIDLFFAEDPTIWQAVLPIHSNVKDLLEIVNVDMLNVVGRAEIPRAPDFKGRFTRIVTAMPHLIVDWDPEFRRRVLAEIELVLGERESKEAAVLAKMGKV